MTKPSLLDSTYYDLTQSLWGAIAQAMGAMRTLEVSPTTPPAILQLRAGYAESPGWFLIQAAEFAPEPLTVHNLRVRDTYASEALVQALLEIMASEKWFDCVDGAYSLRAEGLAVLETIQGNRRRMIDHPTEPARRVHSQFSRLITSSLQSTDPPGVWCLAHSRNRAPAPGNVMVDLLQYTSDFNAFRDDCHMAAWRLLDVDGHGWESFTQVADGMASTGSELFEQLAYRGYTIAQNAETLAKLEARGWLQSLGHRYSVTDQGRAIRQQVEQQTDAYFYAPWRELSWDEQQQLHDGISELIEQLAAQSAIRV